VKTKTKKILKIVVPVCLAIFFGWYTFAKLPVNQIIPYFKDAKYSWLALAVGCGFLSHFSRAYRWKYMLQPLGYKPKLPNSIMAVFIGYLANFGIPRSGEVLRAAVFTNFENVPFEKGFGTIVAERIADMLVMLLIITVTLFLQYDFIYNLLVENFNPITLIIVLIGVIVLGALFLAVLNNARSGIMLKIKTIFLGVIEGATSIFKMKHKWLFILHTLFIWLMYVMMFYLSSFAIPELLHISFGAILIGFISSSFSIAATNGGVFVYPLAIVAAFKLFDIPETPSLAFGWIVWTSQTLLIVIFGSLSFLFLPIYNRIK
jgi:uncharacterized protein (TIRG00374 family)